jgi:hypothetical protein
VTKVLGTNRISLLAAALLALCTCPWTPIAAQESSGKQAATLYTQLGEVSLDPARVYRVRGASLNRTAIQISLDDGTIGFTQDARFF